MSMVYGTYLKVNHLTYQLYRPDFYGENQAPVTIDYDLEIAFTPGLATDLLRWSIDAEYSDVPGGGGTLILSGVGDTRIMGTFRNPGVVNVNFGGILINFTSGAGYKYISRYELPMYGGEWMWGGYTPPTPELPPTEPPPPPELPPTEPPIEPPTPPPELPPEIPPTPPPSERKFNIWVPVGIVAALGLAYALVRRIRKP